MMVYRGKKTKDSKANIERERRGVGVVEKKYNKAKTTICMDEFPPHTLAYGVNSPTVVRNNDNTNNSNKNNCHQLCKAIDLKKEEIDLNNQINKAMTSSTICIEERKTMKIKTSTQGKKE